MTRHLFDLGEARSAMQKMLRWHAASAPVSAELLALAAEFDLTGRSNELEGILFTCALEDCGVAAPLLPHRLLTLRTMRFSERSSMTWTDPGRRALLAQMVAEVALAPKSRRASMAVHDALMFEQLGLERGESMLHLAFAPDTPQRKRAVAVGQVFVLGMANEFFSRCARTPAIDALYHCFRDDLGSTAHAMMMANMLMFDDCAAALSEDCARGKDTVPSPLYGVAPADYSSPEAVLRARALISIPPDACDKHTTRGKKQKDTTPELARHGAMVGLNVSGWSAEEVARSHGPPPSLGGRTLQQHFYEVGLRLGNPSSLVAVWPFEEAAMKEGLALEAKHGIAATKQKARIARYAASWAAQRK